MTADGRGTRGSGSRGARHTNWLPDSFFIVVGLAWLLLAVFVWNNRPASASPAVLGDALSRAGDEVAGAPYVKHAGRRWQVGVPIERPGIPRGTWVFFYRPADGRFLDEQFIPGNSILFERVLWFGAVVGLAVTSAFLALRLRRRAEPTELRTVAPRVARGTPAAADTRRPEG